MDEQERAAYRAFVRDHHPDRGGDPEAFVAGLSRFRTEEAGAESRGEQADPADRHDEAASLPLAGRVAIALLRTVRRRRQ